MLLISRKKFTPSCIAHFGGTLVLKALQIPEVGAFLSSVQPVG